MSLMRRAADRRAMPMRDPFREVMESWFGGNQDPFDGFGGPASPAIDVRETNDCYVVEAELPGIGPEDTEVVLDGRTLTIRGEFSEERQDPMQAGDGGSGTANGDQQGAMAAGQGARGGMRNRYLLRERRRGAFMRVMTLPSAVDADQVTSRFENGELILTLPKMQQARARHIEIQGVSRDGGQGGQQQVPGQLDMGSEQGQESEPAMTRDNGSEDGSG